MQENTTTTRTGEEIVAHCLEAYKTKSRCDYEYAVTRYTSSISGLAGVIKEDCNQDFEDDFFGVVDVEPGYHNQQLLIINTTHRDGFIEDVNSFFADEMVKRRHYADEQLRAYAFIFFESNRPTLYKEVTFDLFCRVYPEAPFRGKASLTKEERDENLKAYLKHCYSMGKSGDIPFAVFDWKGDAAEWLKEADEHLKAKKFYLQDYFWFTEGSKLYVAVEDESQHEKFFENMRLFHYFCIWERNGKFGEYYSPYAHNYGHVVDVRFFAV